MLTSIISQFAIPGTLVKAGRFGSGLINDTYLCEFTDKGEARKYILQRINTAVFKFPEQVMANVEKVTTHIAGRLRREGIDEPFAVTPAIIPSRDNRSFHRDSTGAYWRMFHFIESGIVYDTVQDAHHAREVGRGLGRFQSLVSDLRPETLYADTKRRGADLGKERAFVETRRALANMLAGPVASHEIPMRVVHNDPKVNNVMVHRKTGEALCMLDLDTVKPGIVHFDFGDCVRSAANPAGEDAGDLKDVGIDGVLFEAITAGYLHEAATFLTRKEIDLLPVSVKVITFELGLRFLADYLRGDTYFKIKYPTHNLHRARVQFKLLESIENAAESMQLFVSQLSPFRSA